MRIRYHRQQFIRFSGKFSQIAIGWPAVRRLLLMQLAQDTVRVFKRQLIREKTSGALDGSIGYNFVSEKTVEIGPNIDGGLSAPYEIYLAAGTGPGYIPPYLPIEQWALAKGLKPQGNDSQFLMVRKIQMGIKTFGTSKWASQNYGTGGANPYVARVINDPEYQAAFDKVKQAVFNFLGQFTQP